MIIKDVIKLAGEIDRFKCKNVTFNYEEIQKIITVKSVYLLNIIINNKCNYIIIIERFRGD